MMDSTDTLSQHRHRSIQAVLNDGFRLYFGNIWNLIRSSWIQAVVYAVALGFSMTYFFTTLLPSLKGYAGNTGGHLAVWALTVAVFVVTLLLFAFAGGLVPLSEHYRYGKMARPAHWYGRWPWRATLHGLRRLPGMAGTTLKSQAGLLAAACAVMLLIVVIASAVLMLPAAMLVLANVEAYSTGSLNPMDSLPADATTVSMLTFTLCGLTQAFIHLATLFPLYYIWRNSTLRHDTTGKPTQDKQ